LESFLAFDQRSFDQPPPLENYNPFLNDLAICAALDREGAARRFLEI
jgi:hypothetical protein